MRVPMVQLALLGLAACEGAPTPLGPHPDAGVRKDGKTPAPDSARRDAGPRKDSGRRDRAVGKDGAPPQKDGAPPKPDAAKPYPARYPANRTHSPITPFVVNNLKAIAAKGPTQKPRVFAKVGDSITVSKGFLHCYGKSGYDLGSHSSLGPTVQHFKVTVPGGTTPFNRTSLAATVGWSAKAPLSGTPSPLTKELAALNPRFAVLMYGSNDIGWKNIHNYADNMLTIVDQMLKGGVIPLMSTIPARLDATWANAEVPRYNAVVRGIAQARQVPVMDLHRELDKLAGKGLAKDGVHPNALWTGPCNLTAKGLAYGYNTRNLVTLQTLHRVKAALLDGKPAPDPAGPALKGSGSPKAPFVIDGLPFSDLRDTAASPNKTINSYPGCNATQDESGGEYIYRLTLPKATTIRAYVFDRGAVDIDLHLLGSTVSGAACLKRDHKQITAPLKAGTYHLSLDTFVKGGKAQAGEYLLVVLGE